MRLDVPWSLVELIIEGLLCVADGVLGVFMGASLVAYQL